MKIIIRGTDFPPLDIENRLGQVLLAISQGKKIEQYMPPPNPAKPTVWGIHDALTLSEFPCISAECPQCHNGVRMGEVRPFVHCGGVTEHPPKHMANQLNAFIDKRNAAIRKRQEREPAKAPAHFITTNF